MSTIRATYVQHGSSAVPNITLNASGQVIVASGIVSSGTFAAPTGSAAAPGVYFVGDTNTGLYSPGADQVAISTGGSGKLFINSAGVITTDNGFTSGRLNVVNTNTVATFDRMLLLRSSNLSNAYLGLGSDSFYVASASNAPIVFCTNSDGGTSGSSIPTNERLRITSAGLVGIGTSSPSSTAGGLDISSGGIGLVVGADGSTVTRTNSTDKIFRIGSYHYTNAEEPVCIAFGQNLSSDNELNFGGGSAALNAATYIRFFTAANNTTTTGTERVRIDNAGRVGIGTTTPGAQLSVYGDTVDLVQAYIENNNAAGASGSNRRLMLAHGGTTASSIAVWQNAGVVESTGAGGGLALGAYSAASTDPIKFYTGPGRAERARIDGSGRLLVGTSSSSNLYAIGGANFAPKVQIQGTDPIELGVQRTDGPPYVHIANGQSGLASGNDVGFISFNGKDSNNLLVQAAQISAAVDGTPGANDMPGRLVFSVTRDGSASPTEAVRIKNTGYTTTFATTDGFRVSSAAAAGTGTDLFNGAHSATGIDTGTISFRVTTNGNVTNTNNSYGAISDLKLKENIVDAGSQWDDLKALQVRKYNFKEGQTHTQIGLVAQEVELVSPGLVSESLDFDAEGNDLGTVTKSVNYSVLYMKAVKALQEAMERIEQLEASNADLLARVTALESA
jgi:hypothetical protein